MALRKNKTNNKKQQQRFYQGKNNIKAAGVEIEWTPERMDEWMKCAEDPIYFSEKYVHIVHPDKGLVLPELFDYQREMIQSSVDNRFTAVVTARQAGKTTAAVCIILHAVLFGEYEYIALTANKERTAKKILERIQTAYKHLPLWIQQGVVEWNKSSVKFESGSEIIASATSSDAIRGDSVTFLYIDEIAYVDNWEAFSSSVIPTISAGTKSRLFYTSTPNGLNHFYQIVENARDNKNSFNLIEAPWWRVPGRDEKWRQEALAQLEYDEDKFRQEYEVEFLGSSGTLIASSALKSLVYKDPISQEHGMYQYETPREDRTYVIVADVSHGKGLDYSAASVIDVTEIPYKQVCVYRNNMITPSDYAEVLYRLGQTYNEAFLLIEVNDIGAQVADSIFHTYEYESLLFTEPAGPNGKRIAGGFGSRKIENGIRTTKSVKAIGCSMLKMLIERRQLIIKDFNTIHELSVFAQQTNGSYAAEEGHTDDIVMGLVLFGWMSNDPFFKEITEIDTMDSIREAGRAMEEDLLPFGIVYNGIGDRNDASDNVEVDGDGTVWKETSIF